MTLVRLIPQYLVALALIFLFSHTAHASLSLTAGTNATTTPNVATSISGFQIVGPAASTTPVKLRAASGILTLATTTGVTMTGNGSALVTLNGTVSALNAALATLTYRRASTGTDTLEVSLVEAGEVFFEDNGHLYKYISDAGTWNAAKTKAEALTLYGATGYLTTITSANENSFVSARLLGAGWMGASDSASEGVWRWVTGPEINTQFWSGGISGSTVGGRYANWSSGEPNDSGGEDCAQFLAGGTGMWNDLPCSTFSLPGYVAEFGAPGNMPTIVAQNISIVTADVPALTTLSPLNGASSVSPTANLVIGFSKAVTAESGNIVIRKASDDTVIATIDVTSGLLSGGGTTTITINPSESLPEGEAVYVTVPNTAFKDGSNNFFAGISDETTWAFTVSDESAPVITSLTSSVATTSAAVTWSTNEAASTRVWYSADTSRASSTNETNTSSRVLNHEVPLTGLVACTLYSYQAVSRDAAGNTATSTPAQFTTRGCAGGTTPLSATTTSISVLSAATTTLAESGRTLTVQTPVFITASSSSVIIQIKGMTADPVLAAIGTPGESLLSAATIVFDVTALIDSVTVLDSFDAPVTISYQYTDDDIAGLDESTLQMQHYRSGGWEALDACTVVTSTNTITCTAPHFSIFAIFGQRSSTAPATSRSGPGTSIEARVRNLTDMGNVAAANELKKEWHWLFPQTAQAASLTNEETPVRDLEMGMTGRDVRLLQVLLNTNGFPLASSGVGSPGNETEYFGTRTRAALAAYQAERSVAPAAGYFGPLTRASMATHSVSGRWW